MLGDASTRDGVPSKLHQFGEAAIAPLLEALEQGSEELRYGAVWAIGRVHNSFLGAMLSPVALEPCIKLLNSDESARVRLSALNTLIALADNADHTPISQAFIQALGADQEQIRAEAARWLGQFANPEALEPLHDMLINDPSVLGRGRAAYALAYIEPGLNTLSLTGEIGVDALLTALSDTERGVRLRAIWALGQLKSGKAIKSLTNILEKEGDEYYLEKRKAAEALGQIGDKSAVEALVTVLQTENHAGVRSSAVEALGELGDKRIVEVLVRCLSKDPEAAVRASAAKALESLGEKSAADALISALEDENDDVRYRAAHALQVVGNKRAVQPLSALIEDVHSNKQIRTAAERALEAIQG